MAFCISFELTFDVMKTLFLLARLAGVGRIELHCRNLKHLPPSPPGATPSSPGAGRAAPRHAPPAGGFAASSLTSGKCGWVAKLKVATREPAGGGALSAEATSTELATETRA